MKLQIGINPISWSNDDLQYVGGDISLQTCLADAASAGYQGVELGHKFPRDAAKLKPLLDQYGLLLVSGWYSGQLLNRNAEDEAAAIENHVGLLAEMGCEILIFAEVTGCIHSDIGTRLSQRPQMGLNEWRQFGKRLSEVAMLTADRGLKLCYHHHMGTVVQSADDIDALMQETSDEVHLLLDSGHAMFAGADPVLLAKQYADRIGHLHCKDVRKFIMQRCINRDSSFLDAVLDGVFTVPGDGCIDYAGILEPLANVDYAGWAVVEAEQDPSVAPSLVFAKMGYDKLSEMVATA